jgi:hypothetical protein
LERAADLMSALLGAPVSTGFISSVLVRLDKALITAGFEEELKAALGEQDVLAPLAATGVAAETAATGEACTNPQVYTVRTMHGYTGCWAGDLVEEQVGDLVWYERPQPRPPTHRRHPRRTQRHPLDATPHHRDRPRRLTLSEIP